MDIYSKIHETYKHLGYKNIQEFRATFKSNTEMTAFVRTYKPEKHSKSEELKLHMMTDAIDAKTQMNQTVATTILLKYFEQQLANNVEELNAATNRTEKKSTYVQKHSIIEKMNTVLNSKDEIWYTDIAFTVFKFEPVDSKYTIQVINNVDDVTQFDRLTYIIWTDGTLLNIHRLKMHKYIEHKYKVLRGIPFHTLIKMFCLSRKTNS